MNSDHLTLAADIASALRSRMRKGQGLSIPYARKWEVGGCQAIHSLRTYPYDGLVVLGAGLSELSFPVIADTNRLIVDGGLREFWVAADRSVRGEGPPEAYLVGTSDEQSPRYAGNAAEVVIQLLRGMSASALVVPVAEELQIGFPGLPNAKNTYVGSWQWNVHGEAHDDEFVRRAADATLTAIEAKKERDAESVD